MTIGHNGIAGDELRQFIERIERLEEEKRSLGEDIKEVYAEAKAPSYEFPELPPVLDRRASRSMAGAEA